MHMGSGRFGDAFTQVEHGDGYAYSRTSFGNGWESATHVTSWEGKGDRDPATDVVESNAQTRECVNSRVEGTTEDGRSKTTTHSGWTIFSGSSTVDLDRYVTLRESYVVKDGVKGMVM